ncbi:SdrD B-like domain-containing protein [Glutamicibacter uratoxydans]|uniref:SdrD B-like domain-containing protein n=1 Tax=Glutamicibacter uratoxydans TaxID=43667 RepID=UPI001476AD0E|nr:SdrD B-like domain-containing protein [Glutamicibacter uratoxydans]
MAVSTFGLPAFADVDTKPDEKTESASSIIDLSLLGKELAGGGQSRALFPSGPAEDDGALDASLIGSQLIDLGGVELPVDQVIDYGELGAMLSRSSATDAKNGEAITGIAGADGSIGLDGKEGGFGTAKLDLLSLFKASGADGITDAILSKAELTAGVGGAHVKAVDGKFQDPDNVGGPGQYRVAEANLELQSPLVDDLAESIYDSVGQIDGIVEDSVGKLGDFTTLVTGITKALPAGAEVSFDVKSNMQEKIFAAIVDKPITTKNEILTVDFSKGTIYVDLDKAYSGERPEGVDLPDGINNQAPNTELIDDQLYPIIGESVHDLINEVVSIAVGSIEGALDSVTLDLNVKTTGIAPATASWSVNLMGDVKPVECDGSALVCEPLKATINTIVAPLVKTAIVPIRDYILSDDGQNLYELAITDIKTGAMTMPIRAVLDPFFKVLNQVVSLQLNRQVTTTCEGPDGEMTESLEVSALSLGLIQAADAGRLNLGTAGVRIGACDDAAVINPAITVDPGSVEPGQPTNVTGEGFTPEGDVTLQLTDPDGKPVGDPITVKADPEGKIPSTAVPVPDDAAPGDYKIVATDVTTDTPAEGKVTVTEPGTPQPGNGSIGDTVFDDANKDGLQSDGEAGVPGVTVNLLDADGNPVNGEDGTPRTATTDDSGKYTFDKLPNGDYTIGFVAPEGKTFSPAQQGDDRAVDSDPNAEGVTPVVTVSDDTPTTDQVDAGLVDDDGTTPQPGNGSIGDTVFDDANKDGLQSDGEAGVPGVTVNLLDADGNPVNGEDGTPRTATTDDSGKYTFDKLPNGDYTVGFVAPEGKTFTAADQGDDDSKDSDANSEGVTPVVTLTDDAPTTDQVDAGLVDDDGTTPQPGNGSIGDTVFDDANKDGLQSDGEAGVPGVTVNLLDADGNPVNGEDGTPRTATTDDSGKYTFDKLPNGEYVVEFKAPEGKTFTAADQGDDDAKDSDANVENGRTPAVVLTTEAPNNNTVDAGLVAADQAQQPSITADPTDVKPGEETTVKGKDFEPNETITVVIKDKDGNPVGDPIEVTTDENGEFTQQVPVPEDTAPGEYDVVATDKDGDETTTGINVTDSNNPPAGNGELGDRVWRDADANGIQDSGEAGIQGVKVNLLDASGAPVNGADGNPVTATTDENGNYTFAGLELGEYTVEFVAPEGAKFSPANAGEDRTNDSNAGEDGRTDVVALTSVVPVNTSIDAGIVDAPAPSEATVTADPSDVKPGQETQVTGDGYAPNSEVTVQLVDKDGNPVGDPITVTTDENGHFTTPLPVGEDVEPGDYGIEAKDDQGNSDSTALVVSPKDDGNPNPNPGGEGELGDRVWRDANSDGIQDSSESGLAGAVVNLLDAEGNAVTDASGTPVTTTTDDNGNYAFTGLALGEYIVEFAAPQGAGFSPAEAGEDRALDSNAGENGRSTVVTLTSAAPVDRTIDAGIVDAPAVDEATVSVNPGEVAPGEKTTVNGEGYAPNSEVTVQLVDKDGKPVGDPVKTTTDDEGRFSTELEVPQDAAPGEYTVEAKDAEGNSDDVELTVTEPDGNNGGNNGQLGDRVWRDANGNGLQDEGESGLPDVTVNLLDADGNPVNDAEGNKVSTKTDDNGSYSFAGLQIKQYIVEFVAPEGASFAPAKQGDDRGIDSDAGENGRTEAVTLTSQAPVNNGVDAGVVDAPAVEEATVTVNPDKVAPGEETNVIGDGYAPNSEVTITLKDKDGNPVGDPIKVTTDENGHFSTDVTVPEGTVEGEYTVTAEDAEGNTDSTTLQVTAPDGNGNGNDGASLGDFVWNDANSDGLQTEGEAGVKDVAVNLLDADGNPVVDEDGNPVSTTTGEDGKYGFENLNYGEYVVEFKAPKNAAFTKQAQGNDRSIDSDAGENGRTAAVQLSANAASNTSVDAGLVIDEQQASPEFTVNPDEAAPGERVKIVGEGYAPNTTITIELRDKDGKVVDSIEVTTDDDGKFTTDYTIPEDAKEGDYTVATVDPQGVEQTRSLRITEKTADMCEAEQSIAVSPEKVKAGDTVTVKGQGFTPGQTVSVSVTGEDGKQIEVAISKGAAAQLITIDESCGFEFKIQLPKDIKEGFYTVDVNDEDGKKIDSGKFEVVGSDDNNGNGDNNGTDNNGTDDGNQDNDGKQNNDDLASTGANVIGFSLLGLLAAAGGVVLSVAARRRSQRG